MEMKQSKLKKQEQLSYLVTLQHYGEAAPCGAKRIGYPSSPAN